MKVFWLLLLAALKNQNENTALWLLFPAALKSQSENIASQEEGNKRHGGFFPLMTYYNEKQRVQGRKEQADGQGGQDILPGAKSGHGGQDQCVSSSDGIFG